MFNRPIRIARLLITLAVTTTIIIGAIYSVATVRFLSLSDKGEAVLLSQDSSFRQTIRVWVHSDRVSPDVIYARTGNVLLEVENETSAAVNLKFDRQISGEVPQTKAVVSASGRSKRSSLKVVLEAGEYVFYDETRPSIRGKLIIDPQLR